IAFRTIHLLLPRVRTGLFFVPLSILVFAGALVNAQPFLRSCGIALLAINAVYFIGCLRLGYFKEWQYNSDSKQTYQALRDVAQRCGIDDFVTDWKYVAALNFYRGYYGDD